MAGIGLLITIAGYIIGLGAVTVIDIHGFFGKSSKYWTRATISAHKITKPLIWIGTLMSLFGSFVFYTAVGVPDVAHTHWIIFLILILNGLFLTFWVSPRLLKREREGKAEELLPQSWQNAISVSFFISFFGWWGSLLLFINFVTSML